MNKELYIGEEVLIDPYAVDQMYGIIVDIWNAWVLVEVDDTGEQEWIHETRIHEAY